MFFISCLAVVSFYIKIQTFLKFLRITRYKLSILRKKLESRDVNSQFQDMYAQFWEVRSQNCEIKIYKTLFFYSVVETRFYTNVNIHFPQSNQPKWIKYF